MGEQEEKSSLEGVPMNKLSLRGMERVMVDKAYLFLPDSDIFPALQKR